jgi:hypothetical protein
VSFAFFEQILVVPLKNRTRHCCRGGIQIRANQIAPVLGSSAASDDQTRLSCFQAGGYCHNTRVRRRSVNLIRGRGSAAYIGQARSILASLGSSTVRF